MAVEFTCVTKVAVPVPVTCEAYGENAGEAMKKLHQQLDELIVITMTEAVCARIDMTPICEPLEAYGADGKEAVVGLVAKMRTVMEAQHAEIAKLKAGDAHSSQATPSPTNPQYTWGELEAALLSALHPQMDKVQFAPDATYYVISRHWLRECELARGEGIGPIDTTHLASGDPVKGHCTRNGVVRLRNVVLAGDDIRVVSRTTWTLLVSWFGLRGPAIARHVRQGELQLNPSDIDVYAFVYSTDGSAYHLKRLGSLPYFSNEQMSVLASDAAAVLRMNPCFVKCWDATSLSGTFSYSAEEWRNTLAENGIAGGDVIVVEPVHPMKGYFTLTFSDVSYNVGALGDAPASART